MLSSGPKYYDTGILCLHIAMGREAEGAEILSPIIYGEGGRAPANISVNIIIWHLQAKYYNYVYTFQNVFLI